MTTLRGGFGGTGSGVFAYPAGMTPPTILAIAGGGGGAGGYDGSGDQLGAGGDAGLPVATGSPVMPGGAGSPGSPGGTSGGGISASGGQPGQIDGTPGYGGFGGIQSGSVGNGNWSNATTVTGGDGAMIGADYVGGGGGGGFGGGGGGGADEVTNAELVGGGGGGGSSYIAWHLSDDTTTATSATTSFGDGGGPSTGGAPGGSGGDGQVYLTFGIQPTITSVVPAAGPLAGTNRVSITGTELGDMTAVTVDGLPCTSPVVHSSTNLDCAVPANTAGDKDVAVTTPFGTVTSTGSYSYRAAPTVTNVSPSAGPPGTVTAVTITGTNLTGTSDVTIDSNPCTSITVVSATTVTCSAPLSVTIGAKDLILTTPGGSVTKTNFYTYEMPPSISGVSPSSGPLSGNTLLTISGTDLSGATAVTVDGVACGSPLYDAILQQLTCYSPSGSVLGPVDVIVTTPAGSDTEVGGFTYEPSPAITTVAPLDGPLAGNTPLTITGTNLTGTASVTVGGNACAPVVVNSATQVTCTLPPSVTAGAKNVVLTSPNGSDTKVGGYTYVAAPDLISSSPSSGPLAGGETLTLMGSDLLGTSSVTIGGLPCGSIQVLSGSMVRCTIPAGASTGPKALVITTPYGSKTETVGYRYLPTIGSVSPTSGRLIGGNKLTITGTDLTGATAVTVGGQTCDSPTVVSPTEVTCILPAGVAGAANIVVSSSQWQVTMTGGYTYQAPVVAPPVTTTPTPTPTPTPTTPTPTTPTPAPAPTLSLKLDLKTGAQVTGSQATLSGGGLRAKSLYLLTMNSNPVRVASGYTDAGGNLTAKLKMPAKACVTGGLHELVLTAVAPDGTLVRDSTWLVIDDYCTTRNVSPTKPADKVVTFGTFRFPYASTRLSAHSRSVLKGAHTALRSAKRVTITGYTQTKKKSPAAVRANKALALNRAKAMRSYLRALGVKAPITVVGAGGVNPIKGKPQSFNRRVVITVRF